MFSNFSPASECMVAKVFLNLCKVLADGELVADFHPAGSLILLDAPATVQGRLERQGFRALLKGGCLVCRQRGGKADAGWGALAVFVQHPEQLIRPGARPVLRSLSPSWPPSSAVAAATSFSNSSRLMVRLLLGTSLRRAYLSVWEISSARLRFRIAPSSALLEQPTSFLSVWK
jgi:hypothetical protein